MKFRAIVIALLCPSAIIGQQKVGYNDAVVLSNSNETGCAVWTALESNDKLFDWSPLATWPSPYQRFYVRPHDNAETGNVINRDAVKIAYTAQSYNTSDCGWYGCRVLQQESLELSHGSNEAGFKIFEDGTTRSAGFVHYGDKVVIRSLRYDDDDESRLGYVCLNYISTRRGVFQEKCSFYVFPYGTTSCTATFE